MALNYSYLGSTPSGVELRTYSLRNAGFHQQLNAHYEGYVTPPAFNWQRDLQTQVLNLAEIETYSRSLAAVVESVVQSARFPIVLGGDCSILIGNMLALRRLGRYGLFFIDSHADFYQPEVEPNGEVSSMDLAIVTGYGSERLTNINGLKPLVCEEDVILFGDRDAEIAQYEGSQDVRIISQIAAYDLASIQRLGIKKAASTLLAQLLRKSLDGF